MGSIRLAWKLMLITFFTAILFFSMSPVSFAQEQTGTITNESMTYYLKADDYSLPADGVSSTILRFCLLDPGGYPTFYFGCSNDDCISLGIYGDIDIMSTVQEDTEVLARYTAPKIEPTAQLSDIVVPVAIELEYVSPEEYFPTKTMKIWMNLEIGEYVPPQASVVYEDLACEWAPYLYIPSTCPERITDYYYRVNTYGDRIYISYIVNWSSQRPHSPTGWFAHPFDYEPIVVVLRERESDGDCYYEIERVMYDSGHYSVEQTNSLFLKVNNWSHCYEPLDVALTQYANQIECDKLKVWTDKVLSDMNTNLAGLYNYPGRCQNLNLNTAFYDPWQIRECFGKLREIDEYTVKISETKGMIYYKKSPLVLYMSEVKPKTIFYTGDKSWVLICEDPVGLEVKVDSKSGYYFGGTNQPGYILYGRVFVKDQSSGKRTTYTNNAIVESINTEYEIVVGSERETSVFVFEGSVKLSNLDGSKTVQIDAGKTATVEFNGQPSYPVAFDPATIDRWWETEPGTTPTPATTVEENFNDGKAQNWKTRGSGCWAVTDGFLVMTGNKEYERAMRCAYYDQEFCDFTYQADMRKIAGDSSGWVEPYGIVIRLDETFGNCYQFFITVEGRYMIAKRVGGELGEPTYLIEESTSDALKKGYNQWNTLKVVAQGSTLEFYANNKLLRTIQDASHSCGNVGIFAHDSWYSDSPDTVQFDNVIIIPSTEGARTDVGASTCETNKPPSVSINTVTPASGSAPLTVSIEATAFDPDGGIVEWRWDFGADGIVDVVKPVEGVVYPGENRFWFEKATFTAPPGASITSIVTVEDNCGATASAEFVIMIEG